MLTLFQDFRAVSCCPTFQTRPPTNRLGDGGVSREDRGLRPLAVIRLIPPLARRAQSSGLKSQASLTDLPEEGDIRALLG